MPTLTPSIQAHMNDTNNPHAVTAAQAGAIPVTEKGAAGGVATLDPTTGKLVQMPTAADVGAEPANANIQAHIISTANPHNVTPAQIGAVPTTEKGAANGIPTLDVNSEVVQLPAGAAAAVAGTFVDSTGAWGRSVSVVLVTRDISIAGDQIITGAGFAPVMVEILAGIGGTQTVSNGTSNGTANRCIYNDNAGVSQFTTAALARLTTGAGVYASASVKTMDVDGCTITWTLTGAPIGTASLLVKFYR